MFCSTISLLNLKSKEKYNFENIKIIDLMKSNKDLTISKPTNFRYFKKPSPNAYPLDLNVPDYKYKSRELQFPQATLCFIENVIMTKSDLKNTTPETKIKICAQRATLTRIMQIPVDKYKRSAIFFATKFQNAIYLACESSTVDTGKGGHSKLKHVCFSDKPNTMPNRDLEINDDEQWWCTYQAKLKHFEVIYSAEIIGIEAEEEIKDLSDMNVLNECRFILLRLFFRSMSRMQAIRTFLQGSMINVHEVYCAERTDNFIVHSPLECKNINTLVKDPEELLNFTCSFLYNFLVKIEQEMSGIDCPYTVYQFAYLPNEEVFELSRHKGKNPLSFLSTEFIQHQEKQHRN